MQRSGHTSGDPVIVRACGLVLREWQPSDVPNMVAMFNTREMNRWTPLEYPFDERVASAYVERAHRARAGGTIQLAITEDGLTPLGEVLLFPTGVAQTCEFAYAVGSAYRGRALAARAVRALLPLARSQGYRTARLVIAVDNVPSHHVARAAGFTLTQERLQRRERKSYVLTMATWARSIAGDEKPVPAGPTGFPSVRVP